MLKVSTKSYFFLSLSLILLILILTWLSLFTFSSFKIDAIKALQAFNLEVSQQTIAHKIVLDIRLPRALIAVISGMALACAGAVMQAITNNPLASPSILGINAGAALAMVFAITYLPWLGLFGISTAALFGGAITWFIVMLIGKSWQYGNENTRLVLAGVAISALCAALSKAVIILEEDQATGIMVWLAGTFADSTWNDFYHLLIFVLIGSIGTILISSKLNLLQLGDEYARSLGINPKRYKIIGSVLVLIMVSAVISVVGSLGFVGLLVPHMARFIIGVDHKRFIPIAMLMGGSLVLCADVLSRAIIFPMETPAGAILALIGAPFFIYLIRKMS